MIIAKQNDPDAQRQIYSNVNNQDEGTGEIAQQLGID